MLLLRRGKKDDLNYYNNIAIDLPNDKHINIKKYLFKGSGIANNKVDYELKATINHIGDNCYNGYETCLLYTSPSPRDRTRSRMPSSA